MSIYKLSTRLGSCRHWCLLYTMVAAAPVLGLVEINDGELWNFKFSGPCSLVASRSAWLLVMWSLYLRVSSNLVCYFISLFSTWLCIFVCFLFVLVFAKGTGLCLYSCREQLCEPTVSGESTEERHCERLGFGLFPGHNGFCVFLKAEKSSMFFLYADSIL